MNSLNDNKIEYFSLEAVDKQLNSITKDDFLIVNKDGAIEKTHLVQYCFEQLCGFFGLENRCSKELLELSFMEFLVGGSQVIDESRLQRIVSIAVENKLMRSTEQKLPSLEQTAIHKVVDLVAMELKDKRLHEQNQKNATEIIQKFWSQNYERKFKKFDEALQKNLQLFIQTLHPKNMVFTIKDPLEPSTVKPLLTSTKLEQPISAEKVEQLLEENPENQSAKLEPLPQVQESAEEKTMETAAVPDMSIAVVSDVPVIKIEGASLSEREVKQLKVNPDVDTLLNELKMASFHLEGSAEELINKGFNSIIKRPFDEKNVLHKWIKDELWGHAANGFDDKRKKHVEKELNVLIDNAGIKNAFAILAYGYQLSSALQAKEGEAKKLHHLQNAADLFGGTLKELALQAPDDYKLADFTVFNADGMRPEFCQQLQSLEGGQNRMVSLGKVALGVLGGIAAFLWVYSRYGLSKEPGIREDASNENAETAPSGPLPEILSNTTKIENFSREDFESLFSPYSPFTCPLPIEDSSTTVWTVTEQHSICPLSQLYPDTLDKKNFTYQIPTTANDVNESENLNVQSSEQLYEKANTTTVSNNVDHPEMPTHETEEVDAREISETPLSIAVTNDVHELENLNVQSSEQLYEKVNTTTVSNNVDHPEMPTHETEEVDAREISETPLPLSIATISLVFLVPLLMQLAKLAIKNASKACIRFKNRDPLGRIFVNSPPLYVSENENVYRVYYIQQNTPFRVGEPPSYMRDVKVRQFDDKECAIKDLKCKTFQSIEIPMVDTTIEVPVSLEGDFTLIFKRNDKTYYIECNLGRIDIQKDQITVPIKLFGTHLRDLQFPINAGAKKDELSSFALSKAQLLIKDLETLKKGISGVNAEKIHFLNYTIMSAFKNTSFPFDVITPAKTKEEWLVRFDRTIKQINNECKLLENKNKEIDLNLLISGISNSIEVTSKKKIEGKQRLKKTEGKRHLNNEQELTETLNELNDNFHSAKTHFFRKPLQVAAFLQSLKNFNKMLDPFKRLDPNELYALEVFENDILGSEIIPRPKSMEEFQNLLSQGINNLEIQFKKLETAKIRECNFNEFRNIFKKSAKDLELVKDLELEKEPTTKPILNANIRDNDLLTGDESFESLPNVDLAAAHDIKHIRDRQF